MQREFIRRQIFNSVIDSRLGQTAKNITKLFAEINSFYAPPIRRWCSLTKSMRLPLTALTRMTFEKWAVLRRLYCVRWTNFQNRIILFATTNLFSKFDKAFIRRFDAVIDFGRYTRKDLIDVATSIMNDYAKRFSFIGKNIRLFQKEFFPRRSNYPTQVR